MRTICSIFAKRSFQHWFWVLFILASIMPLASPESAAAAPTVTATTPAAGATEVPVTAAISATFSDPMEQATITPGSITLSKQVRIKAIAAGFNYTLALRDNGTVVSWGNNGNGQTNMPTGLSEVTAIASGGRHSVALKSEGTVVAWGDNIFGKATVPPGLSGVIAVAAGGDFTLALKTDDTIVAWGDNSYGQKTIPGGLTGVTRIAAGNGHALALQADGTVVAWGNNGSGQVTVPPELSGVISVAAGLNHSVALKADGTVIAWGANSKGQTSVPTDLSGVIAISAQLNNTLALKNDGTVVAWGDNSYSQINIPAGLSGITAIAAACYHSVALKNDGTVISWGDNSCSQTTLPAGLVGVTSVAAGYSHTVALKSDGTLFAWGDNRAGQTVIPEGLSGISAVAAGSAHTLSLSNSGVVTAWGRNDSGQTNVPTDLAGVTAVAAGDNHSVAIKNDGTVVAWGLNSYGQTTVPAGLAGVTKIAAGTNHTVALKQDGTVTSWGSNNYNEGTTPAGLSGVIAIAAAGYRSLALKNDGTLSAWGENWQGQSTVPAGLTNVIAIAASKDHSVALKSDGTVVAWGANYQGQTSVPAGLDRGVGIAAGNNYTVAVRNDGTVVAWGDNLYGQTTVPQDPYRQPIEASISYSTGSDSATITPTASLPQATTLTATMNTGVRSLEGIHPATDYSWSFTTSDPVPPVTTVFPAGGTYDKTQNVVLTANEPATIYYTTNGASPTTASPVYSGPLVISVSTTLKFFSRDTAGNSEVPKTAIYTIVADTTPPVTTASPAGGTYSSAQNVTLTANEPATIYYTTNGATPTIASPVYSDAITIPATTTLKFFARDSAGNSEATKSATYTINLDTTPPITTAAPAGGTYSALQNVTLTANEPATIYYTTNGGTPSTSSSVYSVPVPIPATTTLKFFAKDTAGNTETVRTESYTIKQNQTITFAPLPVKTYGDPSFTLNATASSGLPVSYMNSNPAVATVSGNTVTIIAAGSTVIIATQSGNADYNPAAPAIGRTLTVTKASLTVQATDATRLYGAVNPAFSATYSGFVNGDTETALSGAAGLSTSATAITPVGGYPIIAATGTLVAANYSFSFVDGTLTITKAEQTITFNALSAKTYGDLSFSLAATSNSGLPVSYTSSNPAVATISGNTVTILAAGAVVITASQEGDGNYHPAVAVTQSLTINKATATVTLGNLSTTYDGSPKSATATTVPAGLNVTFTYNGAVTTPSAVASYSVIGTISDSNYQGSASGTLTIAKGNQTITFSPLPAKTYGDAAFVLSATASSSLAVTYSSSNSAVATVSGSMVTIIGAGTATITATQAGDGNYNAAPAVVQTLTVNKAVATILFGQLAFIYDGNPKPVSVTTVPAGLTVTVTYDGSATAPIEVGNYTIVATVNNTNYQGTATTIEEISKRSQTITFGPLPVKTYGDAPFLFSADASSNLNLTFEYNTAVATITKQGQKYLITIVGAGTTTVIATQAGNRNYSDAPPVSQTLIINKAAGTVTLGSLSATYDGSAKATTATTNPAGLTVTFTYNGSATAPTAAGSYSVIGTISNTNYQGSASGTLVIAKTGQTISFSALAARSYGDAPFNPNAAASSGLAVTYTSSNPAVATISGTTVTIVGIGTTTITASQGGNGNYNPAAAVPQILTVSKGTATVTLGSLSTSYNGSPRAVTATTVPNGLPVTLTYNGSATAPTAVGTYTVVATVTDSNYDGNATGTLIIAKGTQTITFAPLPAKTYGETAFNLTAASSSPLAVSYTSSNPAVATISGTTATITGAGITTINALQGGDDNYNAAAAAPQMLTVNKGSATITLGSLNTSYNGTAQAATAITVPGSLPVTFTYNGSTALPVAVGTYTVSATVTDLNYEGNNTGTLIVAKGAQTITFGALDPKAYGDGAFTLTAAVNSGLIVSYSSSNPAVATISGTIVTIVGTGTTTITASQGGDGNYSPATAEPRTLTVSKGTATISLGSLSTTYNGTPRAATTTTTPNGLPVTLTYNGSATAPTAAGTYTVAATITSPNYQGNSSGTLTIAKGAQTISFGTLPVKTVGNAPFTLTATSTSGLSVSYTSSNPAVATISGSTVTIVGAGTTTITAIQAGDGNYNAAGSAPQTLTVQPAQASSGKTTITIGAVTSYFDTVAATFAAITPGSTANVKLQSLTFTEAVNLNISGATVSINGGYDIAFTSAAGMTSIQGNLTISAGTLIADRLVIM